MKNRLLVFLLVACSGVLAAGPGVETVFRPVALSGRPAPGLTDNVTFSGFEYVSLAEDGRIVFGERQRAGCHSSSHFPQKSP
ncbi:MAG: hypothetical protein L0Z50_32215 [Verrucomicrobiales bacterium]|nr:hypothetical protein [Verrucomicrobiales bacterium]